jgi:hypothetical protein
LPNRIERRILGQQAASTLYCLRLQSKIRGNHSTDKIDEEVMTDWTVEPLHSEFGARVTGVNFSRQSGANS